MSHTPVATQTIVGLLKIMLLKDELAPRILARLGTMHISDDIRSASFVQEACLLLFLKFVHKDDLMSLNELLRIIPLNSHYFVDRRIVDAVSDRIAIALLNVSEEDNSRASISQYLDLFPHSNARQEFKRKVLIGEAVKKALSQPSKDRAEHTVKVARELLRPRNNSRQKELKCFHALWEEIGLSLACHGNVGGILKLLEGEIFPELAHSIRRQALIVHLLSGNTAAAQSCLSYFPNNQLIEASSELLWAISFWFRNVWLYDGYQDLQLASMILDKFVPPDDWLQDKPLLRIFHAAIAGPANGLEYEIRVLVFRLAKILWPGADTERLAYEKRHDIVTAEIERRLDDSSSQQFVASHQNPTPALA